MHSIQVGVPASVGDPLHPTRSLTALQTCGATLASTSLEAHVHLDEATQAGVVAGEGSMRSQAARQQREGRGLVNA